MNNTIFLDNNSTTPLDPEIRAKYIEALDACLGNPASNHTAGWLSKSYLEEGREKIADSLNTSPECIVFTSGATEANNIVILGYANQNSQCRFITSKIEHSSILEPLYYIKSTQGLEVNLLEVDEIGLIKINENILNHDSQTLISIQHSNNEIGTIQDLNKLKSLITSKKYLIHSDISQSFGKLPCSFNDIDADILTISGHKNHAPLGIGAIAFRSKNILNNFQSIFKGGNHEFNLRPGTQLAALAYAFGNATEKSVSSLKESHEYISELTNKLYANLINNISGTILLGPAINDRLPGNLNLAFPKIDAKTLVSKISSKVCCSTGSACLSTSGKNSHVLESLPISEEVKSSAIRFGVSKFNTSEEINKAVKIITNKYAELIQKGELLL